MSTAEVHWASGRAPDNWTGSRSPEAIAKCGLLKPVVAAVVVGVAVVGAVDAGAAVAASCALCRRLCGLTAADTSG